MRADHRRILYENRGVSDVMGVLARQLSGRLENMVGWYHSHPGYGCWLSGIDCQTQMTQQMFQEPFLAIVIDPHRTIAAGKVELGAFRTYPEVRWAGFQVSSLL